MKYFTSLIIVLLLSFCCYGQDQDSQRFVPDFATPNTASFLTYEDISTNKYTGVPNISIPVYNLIDGVVNIPIDLRYHASGIKVEQKASWVGLGWNLNAGGHITRRTNGRVDENAYDEDHQAATSLRLDFLNKNTPYKYPPMVSSSASFPYLSLHNDYFSRFFEETPLSFNNEVSVYSQAPSYVSESLRRATAVTRGYYKPDIYTFTIPNHTGSFFIKHDEDGKIVLINNDSSLKIERVTDPENNTATFNSHYDTGHENTTVGWQITDANGIIYMLEEEEKIYNPGVHWKDRYTALTFLLTKISYPTGEEVEFVYEEKADVSRLYFQEKAYHLPTLHSTSFGQYESNFKQTLTSNGLTGGSNFVKTEGTVRYVVSATPSTTYKPTYLRKIITPNKIVEFNRNNNRLDLNGEDYLESIKVYHKDDEQYAVKTFNFNYDYFNSDYSYNSNAINSLIGIKSSPSTESIWNYRLKLNSFQKEDNSVYDFTYNNKYNLPPRATTAKDYWGYFNGAKNTTNIPYHSKSYDRISVKNNVLTNVLFEEPGSQGTLFQYPFEYGGFHYFEPITVSNLINANREPNSDYLSTGSLTKIVYPTKGYVEYEYEPNSYNETNAETEINELKNGPGQRIKAIKKYDHNDNLLLSREYEYEFEGISSAKLMSNLNFVDDKITHLNVTANRSAKYFNLELYANPSAGISDAAQGAPIGYSKVLERFVGIDDNYHLIDYYFNESYINEGHSIYAPEVPFLENGNLLKQDLFDSNNRPIKETTFNYENIDPKQYYGYWGKDNIYLSLIFCDGCDPSAGPISSVKTIVLYPYNIPADTYKLKEKIVENKIYNEDAVNVVISRSTFNYDEKNQISEEIYTDSKGIQHITNYKYPYHYNNTGDIDALNENNIIGNPVRVLNKVDDIVISGEIYDFNNKGLVENTYKLLKTDNDLDLISTELVPSEFELKFNYQYDINSNKIIQATNIESGISTSYIWGYNDSQPIAKIENATYAEVESYVINIQDLSNDDDDREVDTFDNTGNRVYIGNEGALRQALQELREELSEAMVSTYTYDPLIGITSMTDPRGYTIYYEYDEFNRLKYVKDAEGNILKENQYNYKN